MAVTWQCAILQLNGVSRISGVVLSGTPFTYTEEVSNLKSLVKLLRTYFRKPYANRKILIKTARGEFETVTDAQGGFSLTLEGPLSKDIDIWSDKGEHLRLIQHYPLVFDHLTPAFYVISDIDDTVMVSHSASHVKRILTLLLKAPHRRTPVPFIKNLLEIFKKQNGRVIYLSKSESNLYSLLSAFILHNNLPQGPLILTPYLKFLQLLNKKSGKLYKQEHIRYVLDHTGDKQFILLGDDSQQDMAIYRRIAEEYPERIMKIYIRQTRAARSEVQKRQWELLQGIEVPSMYFQVDDRASDELKIFA